MVKGTNDSTPSRWNDVVDTFRQLWRKATHALTVRVTVQSRGLLVHTLNPAHQSLIDRIVVMHREGMTSRAIADHLNALGVLSSTGKEFYPALVFGIIRKARLRREGAATSMPSVDVKVAIVELDIALRKAGYGAWQA